VNPLNPKGLMDQLLMVCVGFLTCVVAITIAIYLLARIWYWVLLIFAIGLAIYLLVRWLHGRYERW
jgi:uncharacterized membrane protein (DUF4010 family)